MEKKVTEVTFFDTMESGEGMRTGTKVGMYQEVEKPFRAVLSDFLLNMGIYILKHIKTHHRPFDAF